MPWYVVQTVRIITSNHVQCVQHYFQLLIMCCKNISCFPNHSRWLFLVKCTRQILQGSECYRCLLYAYMWGHQILVRLFFVKYIEGVNYMAFAQFAEAYFDRISHSQTVGIGKGDIKTLLGFAQLNREKTYSTLNFKMSGLSTFAARRKFGFEKCKNRPNV